MKTGVSINDLHQRFAFDELIGNLSNIQVFTESLHSWISNL